jgi:hypothetical protein
MKISLLYTLSAGLLLGTSLCGQSFRATDIPDLGTGRYLGQFEGGLYENGSNMVPVDHNSAGLHLASQVQPFNGKIVFLGIGMSNADQEFGAFVQQAASNPKVNHQTLVILDGAEGGQVACFWTVAFGTPSSCPGGSGVPNEYDRVKTELLAPRRLTEDQVQVLWAYDADRFPTVSLPSSDADAFILEGYFGGIARAARIRYPNLRLMFFTSREYAGYATTKLNPEPYAYESGFSMKWLIQAQIHQIRTGQVDPIADDLDYIKGVAPWLVWAGYTWADGTRPRSDGFVWCDGQSGSPCFGDVDVGLDGTHPSQEGAQDLATFQMNYFLSSPYATEWFLSGSK